jgi:hypothetical protein
MEQTKETPERKSENESKEFSCSFCGKKQNEVEMLIAGPSVYICNECVLLCVQKIECLPNAGEVINAETVLGVAQKIRLMELAYKEPLKSLNSGPDWQDTYKKMVELITGVPVKLSGNVLDLLNKINVGEYHLSITPFSEIHFFSPEESADLEKQMNKETVSLDKELFEMLYLGAISLKMYIDMAPTPVLSHVDKKMSVKELPDYKYATKTIEKAHEKYLSCRRTDSKETSPQRTRDFLKTFPGEKQKITIIKCSDTGFTIHHKHERFSFEAYGARSFEGVIRTIENLLNGYQPALGDRYLKSSLKPTVHTDGCKEPKPLD